MEPDRRIVTRIPMDELWTIHGAVRATRVRELSQPDVVQLLYAGKAQFIRVDLGKPLEWIAHPEWPAFWKTEVRGRVVDPAAEGFILDRFPGQYCYRASEWKAEGHDRPIILVERYH